MNEVNIELLRLRLRKLIANGKNFKSPGVMRKVQRQIHNYEKSNNKKD